MNPTDNHGATAAEANQGVITTLQESLTTTGGLTVEEPQLLRYRLDKIPEERRFHDVVSF